MYAIAIVGDLLSLVPFVNIVSGVCVAVLLALASDLEGVNLYSSKRIGLTPTTILIELVPGLSMIPTWTIRVWIAKRQQQSGTEA